MPLEVQTEANTDLAKTATAEMKKFGITRVAVDYFHCGEFRYTNLQDAIAHAKRRQQTSQT
ncbi:MAG: hypothetical protein ACPGPC_15360 [Alphaproteobacteria bacterium]